MKLKVNDYEKVIRGFLNSQNVDMEVQFSDSQYPISYVPERMELKVNLFALSMYLNEHIHTKLSDKEVIQIMIAHELGHHQEFMFNPFLNPERVKLEGTESDWNRFVIERELGAWKYGKQFVPEHLMEEYDRLNENNIALYKNQYPC